MVQVIDAVLIRFDIFRNNVLVVAHNVTQYYCSIHNNIRTVIKVEYCFLFHGSRIRKKWSFFLNIRTKICSGDFRIQQSICSNTCLSILTSRINTFPLLFSSEKLWTLKKCICVFFSWFHRYIWQRFLI